MTLGVALLAYIVPFIFNYIMIRNEIIRYEIKPRIEDLLCVIMPVFNLIIMFIYFYEELERGNFLNKFFMLNKKGD